IYQQFCGGESLEEAAAATDLLEKYGVAIALDYGVEGKQSEAEFDAAVPQFLKTIDYASSQSNIPFIPIKITGFASFKLLEKLNTGADLDGAEKKAWEQ